MEVSHWTPEEASDNRDEQLREKAEREKERRAKSRQERKWQIKQHMRPRRERDSTGWTEYAAVNPNCANGVREELQYGTALKYMDFLFIQEHRQRKEGLSGLTNWFIKVGWDMVADPAYTKGSDPGGGLQSPPSEAG